jgi:hypothetical protein
MMSQFEELLQQLGKIFNLDLHIDHHHACSISIQDQLTVQLQPDIEQKNLVLFAKIAEVPPGKFRENAFKEALRENGLPDPRIGVFGYSAANNHLILYQKYPMDLLKGDQLAGMFGSFLELGTLWKKAIESGLPCPPKQTSNLFGLK